MNYNKIFLKPFITAVISITLFGLGIGFLAFDINNKVSEIDILSQKISDNSSAINYFASLKADSEKSKVVLSQIQNSLITKDQLLGFAKEINQISRQNNLNVAVDFRDEVLPTADTPRATRIVLSSATRANLDNLANFLKTLETGKYFVKLQSLDAIQDAGQLQVGLNGEIYSF